MYLCQYKGCAFALSGLIYRAHATNMLCSLFSAYRNIKRNVRKSGSFWLYQTTLFLFIPNFCLYFYIDIPLPFPLKHTLFFCSLIHVTSILLFLSQTLPHSPFILFIYFLVSMNFPCFYLYLKFGRQVLQMRERPCGICLSGSDIFIYMKLWHLTWQTPP